MNNLTKINRKELVDLIEEHNLYLRSSRNKGHFIKDELEYRDFSYVKSFPSVMFESLSLKGSSFIGLNLQGINFVKTNLEGVNFTGTNLKHAHFVEISSFQDAQFILSKIGNSLFSKCDLNNADFTNTIFWEDNPKNKRGRPLKAKFANVIYDKITASDDFMSYIEDENYRNSRCKKPPRVMISYAHSTDSDKWVRELASRLREDGVDVKIDVWDAHPGDPLAFFMETNIKESDFVLCICTPLYKEKFNARSKGVGYEANIIASRFLIESNYRKFIPILQSEKSETSIPDAIQGNKYIDLSNSEVFDGKYNELLDTIFKKRDIGPPIGNTPNRYR